MESVKITSASDLFLPIKILGLELNCLQSARFTNNNDDILIPPQIYDNNSKTSERLKLALLASKQYKEKEERIPGSILQNAVFVANSDFTKYLF